MRDSILKAILVVATMLALGCAPVPAARTDLIRHYQCDDGSRFSAEIQPAVARVYTVTGTIELPRQRGQDPAHYTNGLRSIVVDTDGAVRHTVGRRAWTDCRVVH